MSRTTILAALAFIVAGPVAAQEQRVTEAQLPAAVRQTAAAQSAGATVRGYTREVEAGKVEYEVEMMVGGRTRDVSIAPDGSVIEVEQEIPFDSLPAAVQAGLRKRAGHGRIVKVESLTTGGSLVAYEAAVRVGTKHSEVQVGPDGKALAHEE